VELAACSHILTLASNRSFVKQLLGSPWAFVLSRVSVGSKQARSPFSLQVSEAFGP